MAPRHNNPLTGPLFRTTRVNQYQNKTTHTLHLCVLFKPH